MKKIKPFIILFLLSFFCNGQEVQDPTNGARLYILVKTINNNKLKHYGSLEELNKVDFNNINYVSIENQGRKTKIDTLLLYNFFNNSPNLTYLSIGLNVEIDHFSKIEKDNHSIKTLYLSWNNLNTIPKEIEKLKSLELFSCKGNKINSLPNTFSNITSLNTLILGGNNIKEFPKEILELKNLTTLSINEKIGLVPDEIGKLNQLKKIAILSSEINSLPKSFSKLKNLKYINLSENKFEALPMPLLKLEHVKYLLLNQNPINKTEFIKSLKEMKSENTVIYSSLNEADRLELGKLFAKFNFYKETMPVDIERINVD